ncbi:CR1-gamma [Human adenovirus 47]|uniref:CR1-gamma n=1 Tax=Human adenovirus 47 TaxID=46942 RepID=M0QUZ2_9ADEN|nr:CR1-gamma [Human adenovirus 47]
MKAFTACVLISLVTLSADAAICFHTYNLTRGENITLAGAGINTTWEAYHNGWKQVCPWNDGRYVCVGNSSSITNLTVVANANLSSTVKFRAESLYIGTDGYESNPLCFYTVNVIELPTTRSPTTTKPATVRTTIETTTQTTQLDTTVQNTTLLIGLLLREESTTEQTEATSSAFSSTANLTSLASVNETGISLMHGQPYSGLDIQITFLVVCGIFILVVLLYFVCCKAREKSSRPIYRPVIGEPQPLQVEGGLRNLLFSFSVW